MKVSPRKILSDGISSEEKIKPTTNSRNTFLLKPIVTKSISGHKKISKKFSHSEVIHEESPIWGTSDPNSP